MTMLLLANGGAVLAAMLVALATHGRDRGAQWLLAALAAYVGIVHEVVLLCGVAGRLTVGAAAIAVALIAAAAAALAVRCRAVGGSRSAGHRAAPVPPAPAPRAPVSTADAYVMLAAALAGLAWVWPHLVEATRLWIWDDYTYHMVYPAIWLRERAIAPVAPAQAFTMQAWYPLSAGLVAEWFMLPFAGSRGDALAWVSLTGPLYAALIVAGAAALADRLGCRRWSAAVAATLLFTSERIAIMASSFSDADLALAAALFAAVVFAVPRAGSGRSAADPPMAEDRRAAAADAVYAALLTGIALGVKVSAAVPALIVLLMCALRARALERQGRWRAVARVAAVFALGWTVTGGYWYARNLLVAGNPVYPAAFVVWPGAAFGETTLAEYARRYGRSRAIADALAVYLQWSVLHAALAMVGLAGLATWLASRWRCGGPADDGGRGGQDGGLDREDAAPDPADDRRRPRAYFAAAALAIALATVALLPSTPYSAGNAMTFRSGFVHWDSSRYVALLPLLGWAALALLVDAGRGAGRVRALGGVLVASLALLSAPEPWLRSPGVAVALALAAVAIAAGRVSVPLGARSVRATVGAAAAAAALLGAAVAWRHDAKAAATERAVSGERFFGAAARALDGYAPGTRVAVFGDQWIYPAFGARHHLVPVRVDGDGRAATAPIGDQMAPGPPAVDAPALVSNLAGAGIRLVVVVHLPHPGRSPDRPAQEAQLRASGAARLVSEGEAVTLWDLGERGATRRPARRRPRGPEGCRV